MWMDAPKYWIQPGMLACSSYSSWALQLSAERQREGDGKRQASKGVHPTALFADCGMHTSTPNHTAVNQCGGLSMEQFKVNKHHSPLVETAGGYVHLGCVPAALLHVHSCLLLLYSNVCGSLLLRLNWHACISICCPAAGTACTAVITSHALLNWECIEDLSTLNQWMPERQFQHWLVCCSAQFFSGF